MKTTVIVTAQYHENKAFWEGGEAWKPKGGQEFILKSESDHFMYAEEECVEVIKEMLKERSNNLCRFTYITHELKFHDPILFNDFEERFHTYMQGKSETAKIQTS